MCESLTTYNMELTLFLLCLQIYMGPNDNFDLETSHVLPAILRKIHESKINNLKEVEIWGSGKPRREFMYSEDMADACVFLMENIDFTDIINLKENNEVRNTHINIGTGTDISIKELALLIKKVIHFEGNIIFDSSKPDGTMIKLTNPKKLEKLGWKSSTTLEEGIKKMYEWYKNESK